MIKEKLTIFLADDDADDCLFFSEALNEIGEHTLNVSNDGEELLHKLKQAEEELPHVIFVDLNMPRINGLECLLKIKQDEILTQIPVIVYSTSYQQQVVDLLHENGARHFICKPVSFAQLKEVINIALVLISTESGQPEKDRFVIPFFKEMN